MTATRLLWSLAEELERAAVVAALNRFTCTDARPGARSKSWRDVTPAWWEYEVQGAIRDLRPPFGVHGRTLRLGYDQQGLAAVCHVEQVDGPGQVELALIAVERRLRGTGHLFADETVAEALDDITGRAIEAGVDEVLVQAYVWHQNVPSQALCARQGMARTGDTGEGVEVWSVLLDTSLDEQEEAADVRAFDAALAEGGPNIPLDEV